MFSKQRQFVPKSLPQPKVKLRAVPVEPKPSSSSKPRASVNGARAASSGSSSTPTRAPSRPTSAGVKRSADGRPRSSNSPYTSSADERRAGGGSSLKPPVVSSRHKRIRSPATDNEVRINFDSDDDANDDDWENNLKRRRNVERTVERIDPNRQLRHPTLTELSEAGYEPKDVKTVRFVHASEIVSLSQGDAKIFPDAEPEKLFVDLQYPGSLTRERFELAKQKDKLDVTKDIVRVVKNVKDFYISDQEVRAELEALVRKLERNSHDNILDLAAFKEALEKYNETVLGQLKKGAIVANIDKQHVLPDNLVSLILDQVYDRVVTPKVDALRRYQNGTDNVYGEMRHNFITQALSHNLRMTSDQVFVDLGSGVGNVVLQAALEIGCESWGCEMMEAPSKLAKEQYQEFRARCKLWGIKPGRVRIIQGDFTKDQDIHGALKRADVVLANNQAFTSELNDRLKIMFLDLKLGCKIVSLKKFTTAAKHNTNDIANMILSEPEHHRWPGKGVSWTNEVGDYHITTKIEGIADSS